MFQWRLKLREAKLAAGEERLEEASRLLAEPMLKEFLPAQRLAATVAGKLLDRARERFRLGQSAVGWQDVQLAENLGGHQPQVDLARRDAIDDALREAKQSLAAGEPQAAYDRLTTIVRRGGRSRQVEEWRELARQWSDAEPLAARGDFRAAISLLERAERRIQSLLFPSPRGGGLGRGRSESEKGERDSDSCPADPPPPRLSPSGGGSFKIVSQTNGTMEVQQRIRQVTSEFQLRAAEHEQATHELHSAATKEEWSEALAIADRVLAISPQDRTAQRVRWKAWQAIGLDVTQHYEPQRAKHPVSLRQQQMGARVRRISTKIGPRSAEDDTVTGKPLPDRRLVWVDAVGGYLICLDDEIVLGQPSRDNPPAVPILADLSRRHAVLRRAGGSYVLDPVQATKLDDREITGPVTLGNNHRIQLGDGVRIHFCRPHALSATARLIIESNHKTEPSVDAVILMAESCILGPQKHSHIRCRDWEHDLILFRKQGELGCRAEMPLTVNGEEMTGTATISAGSRIEGEDFALSVEYA